MCLRLPILGFSPTLEFAHTRCAQILARGSPVSPCALGSEPVRVAATPACRFVRGPQTSPAFLSLHRRPLLVQQVTAAWLRLDLQSHASLHHATRWDSSGRGHSGPPSCSRPCGVEASDALELARAVGVPTSPQLAWRLHHRPSWCQPARGCVSRGVP